MIRRKPSILSLETPNLALFDQKSFKNLGTSMYSESFLSKWGCQLRQSLELTTSHVERLFEMQGFQ